MTEKHIRSIDNTVSVMDIHLQCNKPFIFPSSKKRNSDISLFAEDIDNILEKMYLSDNIWKISFYPYENYSDPNINQIRVNSVRGYMDKYIKNKKYEDKIHLDSRYFPTNFNNKDGRRYRKITCGNYTWLACGQVAGFKLVCTSP